MSWSPKRDSTSRGHSRTSSASLLFSEDSLGHQRPKPSASKTRNRLTLAVTICILFALGFTFLPDAALQLSPQNAQGGLAWGRAQPAFSLLEAANSPLLPIPSYDEVAATDEACRTSWIRDGELCAKFRMRPYTGSVDTVWTWENTSDPSFKDHLPPSQAPFPGRDELLLFSLRAAQANFLDGFGALRLVLADFPLAEKQKNQALLPSTSAAFVDERGQLRMGQLPSWFDETSALVAVKASPNSPGGAQAPIQVEHHWNLACGGRKDQDPTSPLPPSDPNHPSFFTLTSLACKQVLLRHIRPSVVDRLAIEAPNLSDVFVLMRDNVFVNGKVASTDFSSVLYGPVLRFSSIGVGNDMTAQALPDAAQQYANALISRRFGQRDRLAVLKGPAAVVRSVAREAEQAWRKEWQSGADLDPVFLSTYYLVERHREALLWSFLVARHDANADGLYSKWELSALLKEIGITSTSEPQAEPVKVPMPERTTLANGTYARLLKQAGLEPPSIANIRFSSQDGYFRLGYRAKVPRVPTAEDGVVGGLAEVPSFDADLWKSRGADIKGREACELATVCFAPYVARSSKAPVSVDEVFKRVAFQHWGCGDCLIALLLSKSGKKGLKAFLPGEGPKMPGPAADPTQIDQQALPHLPVSPSFETTDFTLAAVARSSRAGGMDRLTFAVRLLQRYQHVVGNGGGKDFIHDIVEGQSTKSHMFDVERGGPAYFVIEDRTTTSALRSSDAILSWLSLRYPGALAFEKPQGVHSPDRR